MRTGDWVERKKGNGLWSIFRPPMAHKIAMSGRYFERTSFFTYCGMYISTSRTASDPYRRARQFTARCRDCKKVEARTAT